MVGSVPELAALSQRAVEVAGRIAASWPDWNAPQRILERSIGMLPANPSRSAASQLHR